MESALIKTEAVVHSSSSSSSPPFASKPPGLLPIPGHHYRPEASEAADKQVQAAMAMAAFYSQSPLWQVAVAARERLQQQQQQHATVPHPAAAVMGALGRSSGSSSQTARGGGPPPLPLPGLANLAGLGVPATSSSSLPTSSGLRLTGQQQQQQPTSLEQYRDYLTKLAQSTLHLSTSMAGGGGYHHGGGILPPLPQYLQHQQQRQHQKQQ